jgi:hypothetical protein
MRSAITVKTASLPELLFSGVVDGDADDLVKYVEDTRLSFQVSILDWIVKN